MQPELTLRPASGDDEDFLWHVYATTRAEEIAAWGWMPAQQESFLRMQYRARGLSYGATYPVSDKYVVLAGEVPIGTMIVSRKPFELRLVDIALLPEHRGGGNGMLLLSDLIREASACAIPMRLSVAVGNPAQRLYARLGFVITQEDAMYIEMECQPKVP